MSDAERTAAMARDIQRVRRLVGFADNYVDPHLDALCAEAIKNCHHYDTCAEYVRERLGVNRSTLR